MSDDYLSSWRRQRLEKLKRELSEKESREEESPEDSVDARQLLIPLLRGRALEVLRAAEYQYPSETARIEEELGRLIREKRITGPITGEALYTLFRRLGLRVRLKTKIVYLDKGKERSLSDVLKGDKG